MKKLLFILVIVLTILPFFHPGLFDVHDPTSAFRLYTLVQTIKAGQFPASWSNLLNFGYGYPIHLFYAPLFTYLGTIFVPLFGSYEVAVKLSLVIASIIGSLGIYKVLEKYGTYPAILGSIAFTFLPYRASAIYVRGSYSEFLAMSLLPWVIYYWTKPQNSLRTILITSLVTSLFTLSHNTLPVLAAPIIFLMIILFQLKYLKGSAYTLITTFGLTAWFILPVLFERGLVQVDSVARLTNYRDHFLAISQLWYSPWGYGGSTIGIEGDHMSFMIGKGQIILAVLGLALCFVKKMWKQLILFVFIAIFAIYLSLPQSSFIWQAFPILSVMQFPWRSLAVVGVGVSILSGLALLLFPKNLQLIFCLLLSFILIYTNFTYFHPQEYRNYNLDILSSQNNLDPLVRDKIPEYLPIHMPRFPATRGGDGFTRSAVAVTGNLNLGINSSLIIDTAYMPHWQLQVDGKQVEIKPSKDGLVETTQEFGTGLHSLNLTWHRTLIEKIALGISALTILAVVGLLIL